MTEEEVQQAYSKGLQNVLNEARDEVALIVKDVPPSLSQEDSNRIAELNKSLGIE